MHISRGIALSTAPRPTPHQLTNTLLEYPLAIWNKLIYIPNTFLASCTQLLITNKSNIQSCMLEVYKSIMYFIFVLAVQYSYSKVIFYKFSIEVANKKAKTVFICQTFNVICSVI